MIKRFIKLLLVIIFVIPCMIANLFELIIKLLIYDTIMYIFNGKSREDFDDIKFKGTDFLLKILEL